MLPFALVWIGTLPGWLTLVAVLALFFLIRGGQLGPALGYLRDANSTLADENKELRSKLRTLEAENLALLARTDLGGMQERILSQAAAHEVRAQDRFEKTCQILDLIANRLGPELNGEHA